MRIILYICNLCNLNGWIYMLRLIFTRLISSLLSNLKWICIKINIKHCFAHRISCYIQVINKYRRYNRNVRSSIFWIVGKRMKCLLTHNDGQKRNSLRKSEAEEKWDTLGGLIFINKHKGWYAEMSIEGACLSNLSVRRSTL